MQDSGALRSTVLQVISGNVPPPPPTRIVCLCLSGLFPTRYSKSAVVVVVFYDALRHCGKQIFLLYTKMSRRNGEVQVWIEILLLLMLNHVLPLSAFF